MIDPSENEIAEQASALDIQAGANDDNTISEKQSVMTMLGYDRFMLAVDLIDEWEIEESHMSSDLVDRLFPILTRN